MKPLLSGRGHLKSTWNGHFYCCQAVLNGHLYYSTTQHARHQKWERFPPTNFFIFTFKNVTWQTYLISFTVHYCILFRLVSIELVSLIVRVLPIWVAIYVYGTYDQLVLFNKEIMQTYIVKVSGSILNVSTVHLKCMWHLIWCYLLKPVLGGHPVLSGHYSIPRECLLNTPGGGYFRNFWVGMCRWEPGTLNLYQS